MQKANLIEPIAGELAVLDAVLPLYGIKDWKAKRNIVGYVNKTYIIEKGSEKFVLRQSSAATDKDHLLLETEALNYLQHVGYPLSPKLLPALDGSLLTSFNGRFYTLQNFVPGEIRASWNHLDDFRGEMADNFFRAAAEFSKAVQDFVPSRRYQNFPLPYFTMNAGKLLGELLDTLQPSPGRDFIQARKEELLRFAHETQEEFDALGWSKLPQQLVHFDLHPGNVHYDGDRVVGLFDFDWIRFESKFADAAGSVSQSCWNVGGEQSGVYIKEKVDRGLRAYREAYGTSEYSIQDENRHTKNALRAYLFFQLLWAGGWYKDQPPTDEGVWILELNANGCLKNDYDSLFS